MFKVDLKQQIRMPSGLFGEEDSRIGYFRHIEFTLNEPVWLLKVSPRPSDDEEEGQDGADRLWRQFQFCNLNDVLQVVAIGWGDVKLHVMLPAYMTGGEHPTLSPCLEIWQCETLDGMRRGLRIKTPQGTVLDGIDAEENPELRAVAQLWPIAARGN